MKRYNIAWWAYSYPITVLALAATRYAQEVKGGVPHAMRLILSGLSVLVLFTLLFVTLFNHKLLLSDDDPMTLSGILPSLSSDKSLNSSSTTLETLSSDVSV